MSIYILDKAKIVDSIADYILADHKYVRCLYFCFNIHARGKDDAGIFRKYLRQATGGSYMTA